MLKREGKEEEVQLLTKQLRKLHKVKQSQIRLNAKHLAQIINQALNASHRQHAVRGDKNKTLFSVSIACTKCNDLRTTEISKQIPVWYVIDY